ncbi:mechanosensitive ion channel family protein [Histidinibacterium lentulum]|nr:mechanosensitive ion channel domain-containing protein [Histidinibacterium lentulum]
MIRRFLTILCLALVAALPSAAQDGAGGAPETFEVDALNPQLGPVPDRVDRATPRATVDGFLRATSSDDLEAAVHYLNVTGVAGTEAEARRLADQLGVVIDRAVVIDWEALTDRPDALLDTARSEDALSGEIRRSILLGQAEMHPQPIPVRVNRVEAPGMAPVWVFSRETVAEIPDIYARHGPSRLERSLPDALRGEAWFGLMWWELLALPLGLALMALTGWLAWAGVGRISRGTSRAARLMRAGRAPLALFAATATAGWLIGGFFAFSSEISHIADPLVALGLALAILLFVLRGVDVIIEDLVSFDDATLRNAKEDHRRAIATRVSAFRRAVLIVVVIVAIVVAVHEAQLSSGLGLSFLASAGLLTLVFGFAARTILGNILASMQIALNQSARIGDKVTFKDRLCHVERIHFTFVQLRVWTGIRLIVPVSEFVSEPFENWTMQERPMNWLIRLRLAHDADVEALRRDFDRIMDSLDPEQLDDRANAFVAVTDHDILGKEVTFGLPCANPDTAWFLSCEAREKLITAAADREARGETMFAEAKASEAA